MTCFIYSFFSFFFGKADVGIGWKIGGIISSSVINIFSFSFSPK